MPPGHPARRPRAWVLGAAALALALQAPTVGHGFVFDDDIVVVKKRLIRSLASFPSSSRETNGRAEETLFRKALESRPAPMGVHAVLTVDRDPEQALLHIRRCIEISDRDVEARFAPAPS